MGVPICEHVKMDGIRCGSPALHGGQYCYYHDGQYRAVPSRLIPGITVSHREESIGRRRPSCRPQSAEDVQIGFMQMIYVVAGERLEPRRARLILSELKRAAMEIRQAMSRAPMQSQQGHRLMKETGGASEADGGTSDYAARPEFVSPGRMTARRDVGNCRTGNHEAYLGEGS